jgi:hypothetical protein
MSLNGLGLKMPGLRGCFYSHTRTLSLTETA